MAMMPEIVPVSYLGIVRTRLLSPPLSPRFLPVSLGPDYGDYSPEENTAKGDEEAYGNGRPGAAGHIFRLLQSETHGGLLYFPEQENLDLQLGRGEK